MPIPAPGTHRPVTRCAAMIFRNRFAHYSCFSENVIPAKAGIYPSLKVKTGGTVVCAPQSEDSVAKFLLVFWLQDDGDSPVFKRVLRKCCCQQRACIHRKPRRPEGRVDPLLLEVSVTLMALAAESSQLVAYFSQAPRRSSHCPCDPRCGSPCP